ncbi:MAG: hypothetical protein ACF8TS_08945 [Maioricimonas sp. JB049]
MPIRNLGTLLESIVLVEAARSIFAIVESGQTIEFVNAFAMPPLTIWSDHTQDRGFDTVALEALKNRPPNQQESTCMRLLRRCLLHNSECGPNGALFVNMLLRESSHPSRIWLNDLPDDGGAHYPDAPYGFDQIEALTNILCPLHKSQAVFHTCDTAFPESLQDLSDTIAGWREQGCPNARLGFLAPMKYSIDNPEPNQTSSLSFRQWLSIMDQDVHGPVVSVHFTGNPRRPHELSHELHRMHRDGVRHDYAMTEFRHANYAVVVHVKNCDCRQFGNQLEDRVTRSWASWFEAAPGVNVTSSLFVSHRRRLFG